MSGRRHRIDASYSPGKRLAKHRKEKTLEHLSIAIQRAGAAGAWRSVARCMSEEAETPVTARQCEEMWKEFMQNSFDHQNNKKVHAESCSKAPKRQRVNTPKPQSAIVIDTEDVDTSLLDEAMLKDWFDTHSISPTQLLDVDEFDDCLQDDNSKSAQQPSSPTDWLQCTEAPLDQRRISIRLTNEPIYDTHAVANKWVYTFPKGPFVPICF